MTLTTVPKAVDPRAWNLLVGTALLAGCNPRLAADEHGETSTTSDSTDTDSTDTDPTAEPECRVHEDCGAEYCDNGACVECIFDYNCGYTYYGFCNDGVCDSNAPECYQYDPCPKYSYCDYSNGYGGNCVELRAPPPECEPGLIGIPTAIEPGAAPLALSFADLDDDGQDELVVATETELLIYESGDDSPSVVPRNDSGCGIRARSSAAELRTRLPIISSPRATSTETKRTIWPPSTAPSRSSSGRSPPWTSAASHVWRSSSSTRARS